MEYPPVAQSSHGALCRLVLEEDDSDGSDSDGWETDSADDDGAAGPSDPQQSGKGKSYLLASWRTQHRCASVQLLYNMQRTCSLQR